MLCGSIRLETSGCARLVANCDSGWVGQIVTQSYPSIHSVSQSSIQLSSLLLWLASVRQSVRCTGGIRSCVALGPDSEPVARRVWWPLSLSVTEPSFLLSLPVFYGSFASGSNE